MEEITAVNTETDSFKNYALTMSKENLDALGKEIYQGYINDLGSMSQILEFRKEYEDLISMKPERKDWPWPGASNIKLPTITTACVNFQSRSALQLLPANRIVNALPLVSSPEVEAQAHRVQKHMNYQLSFEMEEFYDSFDNTLFLLAMDGFAFRKVYWDSNLKRPVSLHVLPEDFIVDVKTRSLDKCYRYSQRLFKNINEIRINQKNGLYKDIPEMLTPSSLSTENIPMTEPNQTSESVGLRLLVETHSYAYLEDESVQEPVVITWDFDTQQIVRMVKRINPDTGKEMKFFTNYTFITNPKSIFSLGFGALLFGITHGMNTSINQLTDSGHLSVLQGGFMKRTSQMSRGNIRHKMGEFIEIDSRDDDIRKAVMPFTFQAPSTVLMSLAEYLQGYVDRLTTVTELFTGSVPRSDTTATSTSQAMEQGAKVFTAIQQRIHRTMGKEFMLVFNLNALYLETDQTYSTNTNGIPSTESISRADYDATKIDMVLVADPTIISQQQLIQKAEYLFQAVMQNPFLAQNPQALALVTKRRLEAMNEPDFVIQQVDQIMIQTIQQTQQNLQAQQTNSQQMNEETLKKAHELGAVSAHIDRLEQEKKNAKS